MSVSKKQIPRSRWSHTPLGVGPGTEVETKRPCPNGVGTGGGAASREASLEA